MHPLTVLAALALPAHAAVLARDEVIVAFDAFDNCDDTRTQSPMASRVLSISNLTEFQAGPSCVFFNGGTEADDVGAVAVSQLGPGCELLVYVDQECKGDPARPLNGWCVWNAARFRAYSVTCGGEVL